MLRASHMRGSSLTLAKQVCEFYTLQLLSADDVELLVEVFWHDEGF
jgi:hypothetical protein